MGVRTVAGTWKPRVISSRLAGGWTVGHPTPGLLGGGSWLCFKHPVVKCQVLGTDLRSSAVLTLSLLLPTFPHGPHGESHVRAPEQKMFRDRSKPTLFQAETVPETVPVLSLVITKSVDTYRGTNIITLLYKPNSHNYASTAILLAMAWSTVARRQIVFLGAEVFVKTLRH